MVDPQAVPKNVQDKLLWPIYNAVAAYLETVPEGKGNRTGNLLLALRVVAALLREIPRMPSDHVSEDFDRAIEDVIRLAAEAEAPGTD